MIIVKSDHELELMRISGKVTAYILKELNDFIRPGITTLDIDRHVEKIIRDNGMEPTFKGYGGFPASVCASINEEVVHGIPSEYTILHEGDIISIDVGSTYEGYVSDAARTYPVGEVSETAKNIMDAAEQGFFEGLKYCRKGFRISDISHAVQKKVEELGFGVIRDYVGHGVGRNMHEEPQIPNYGKSGRGPRIAKGMCLAIEPMITEGTFKCRTLDNGWTVVTQDGGLAAHYENTVAISDDEPEVLTL
ncbi:MAG: type I methionyl aminopeptidase [Eubacteriaceae bacterium]|jgi:methionyl aminopeptidase|nr:type I methionyl aminopeptidase [Eubacteriaceae bacterium]